MPQKSVNQKRIDNLTHWARDTAFIPGMKQGTFVAIIEYVLGQQEPLGSWNFPVENWQVVMTAVVLKALSCLAFELDDTWKLKDRAAGQDTGGVRLAALFVAEEVAKKQGDPKVGDDIWDGCQAAIALAKFGMQDKAKLMVANINGNWKGHWAFAVSDINMNRWCGPAYLAAMVDVLREYQHSLDDSKLLDAFRGLRGLEAKDTDKPLGFFKAADKIPRAEMDLWNTALVLRTLCAASPEKNDTDARDQVQRVTVWILKQLDDSVWKGNLGERPMLLARSLHGLRAALPLIDDDPTRLRVRDWLRKGNQAIEDMFGQEKEHNLKSYTAVVEYLADLTVDAPAGLIFHASQILTSALIESIEPQPTEGGLRIGWLSDLHIAQTNDPLPGAFSSLKRFVRGRMWFKDTPLTEYFQSLNVQSILKRAGELDFDHFLVTGDLTNYALRNQFDAAKASFMTIQAAHSLRRGVQLRTNDLDRTLWTILPGNHDVSHEEAGTGYEKANLGMFFNTFGNTYNKNFVNRNFDEAFPVVKDIDSRKSNLRLRLIGLDSNVRNPVWEVGVNARGKIDSQQMSLLRKELADVPPDAMTLVALHHHPIVVVELGSKLEDYFLSLKETQGRELIKLCASMNVSAILHGHFHAFSSWSGLTNQNRHLAIIGSSAGTLVIPGTNMEFLELREADVIVNGVTLHGLALYVHQHTTGDGWGERYTDIFLPHLTSAN
jgi:3',5'-cyclic AMP phosphodiesterase CpdA